MANWRWQSCRLVCELHENQVLLHVFNIVNRFSITVNVQRVLHYFNKLVPQPMLRQHRVTWWCLSSEVDSFHVDCRSTLLLMNNNWGLTAALEALATPLAIGNITQLGTGIHADRIAIIAPVWIRALMHAWWNYTRENHQHHEQNTRIHFFTSLNRQHSSTSTNYYQHYWIDPCHPPLNQTT